MSLPPEPGRVVTPTLTPLGRVPEPPTWTRLAVFMRLFAVQGSWNYETMLGTGVAFCVEPVLRHLPGGAGGPAYREAITRETRFFNAHPYFASVAVGALARAELDGAPPAHIEKFRAAMCGPLGSLGDRLVWAGWLPFCSLVALLAFGLGARPLLVVAVFLVLYNAGHIALRYWGVSRGWRSGTRVAAALGTPFVRESPHVIARAVMLLTGAALPMVIMRLLAVDASHPPFRAAPLAPAAAVLAALVLGAVLVRLHGRIEGWRAALVVLVLLILYSVTR